MINEVVDHLLLLAVLDPEHMACFKVYDVRSITTAIVKLELINAKEFSLLFGLDKLLATVGSIEFL